MTKIELQFKPTYSVHTQIMSIRCYSASIDVSNNKLVIFSPLNIPAHKDITLSNKRVYISLNVLSLIKFK